MALSRKNALFAGSDEGGENWAAMASLIETCKLNAVNPQNYLANLLTRLVTRSARFDRNTRTTPENGCSPSASAASAASPCAPLRKSTGRVATRTRTPLGIEITSPTPGSRAAPRPAISCRSRS